MRRPAVWFRACGRVAGLLVAGFVAAGCGAATTSSASSTASSSGTPSAASRPSSPVVAPAGDHSSPAAAVSGFVQALAAFDGSDPAALLAWIAPSQRATYASSLQSLVGRHVTLRIDGFRVTDVAFSGESPDVAEVGVSGTAVLCTGGGAGQPPSSCMPAPIGPGQAGRLVCRREAGYWYVALPQSSTTSPSPSASP